MRIAYLRMTRSVLHLHDAMSRAESLTEGRAAYLRRAWNTAYARLAAADAEAALEGDDLEHLGMAAHLSGRDEASEDALARAHQTFLTQGDTLRAARCAIWLIFELHGRGEMARSSGWAARAERLLAARPECVERGYLLVPSAIKAIMQGDFGKGRDIFAQAVAIGERFGDRDLVNLAQQGRARAMIRLGTVDEGVALMDEVMVAVTSGELSPIIVGTIYCSVVEACFELFDMRRVQEWTEALGHWCEAQPDLVAYRGECLVRRAEIKLLQGLWPDAEDEARHACDQLTQPTRRGPAGAAYYQLAEVHRLRGEFAKAEEAYRLATDAGRSPHPGMALLRLAQGRGDDATAAICRVLDEARDRRARSRLLGPAVEILLEGGLKAEARRAAEELQTIASVLGTPYIRAIAARAMGAVLMAEGDSKAALSELRSACEHLHEIEAPYEAARVNVLLGLACRQMGDGDSGRLELETARRVFRQLGASPDLAAVDGLLAAPVPRRSDSLTSREIEVLRLVASGRTNRAIAGELRISEKTVARHLSNIFTKLDLPSRAAATAYAFQHRIV